MSKHDQKNCIRTGNPAQNQAQLPDGCYGCRRRNRDGFACVCGRPAGDHQCTERFCVQCHQGDWCHSAGLRHCADRSCPQKPRCRAACAGLYDIFWWCHHLLCQGYSGYDSVRRSTTLIILDYFPGKCYIILSEIPILSISIMR